MEFHNSYREIMNGVDPLCKIAEKLNDTFKDINLDSLPKNCDTVISIAPLMISGVKREQVLIDTHQDYYIARDTKTNTIYMCFRNILVIDIDEPIDIQHFNKYKDYAFRIYKTQSGYHVFCISDYFEYRSEFSVKFMLQNFADFYYSVFSYIRGYSVRLNPKFNEHYPIYSDLGVFGDPDIINSNIDELVKKHYSLCDNYKDNVCLPK